MLCRQIGERRQYCAHFGIAMAVNGTEIGGDRIDDDERYVGKAPQLVIEPGEIID